MTKTLTPSEKIRISRERKKLTQAELGQASGVTGNYISQIEIKGEIVENLTLKTMKRIAAALEETVSYLFLEEEVT